ncbi:MAG: hypothetical protein FRX48_00894 [Lasallia pustulata]|uniref:Tetratricopeptide-like helical domain n=1 Tax=Lasallia pustulata TaxID=136370 RepID=A0A5M8Q1U4_9LECA|nr:MAG: hypothetical protein FRX48_00894 [Lasallia pustulata]
MGLPQGPETADDFLAAGVHFEEAGEKWRAGDAAKATRFFVRAIETYDSGLQGFPHSFDLAYNKARVQYEITQNPRLASQLPTPLIHLLQIALDSNRYAVTLNQENADGLFNTAQVLTSLAETVGEGRHASEEARDQALKMLQAALELFQRCLTVQEFQFTRAQEQAGMPEDDATNTEDNSTVNDNPTSEGERWASIIEPITKDSLLDTALAQLETLTTVCGLVSSQGASAFAWIEEYSRNLLQPKIAAYIDGTNRNHEVALARANFTAAYSDASFRAGQLDLPTYERDLTAAFSQDLDLSTDPQGLCDRADALIALNASIVASTGYVHNIPVKEIAQIKNLQWQQLTKALNDLAAAAKLPAAENLSRIHMRRGDCELLRLRLSEQPVPHATASTNRNTLLKNAKVHYQSAAKLAAVSGSADEETEASAKAGVVDGVSFNETNALEPAAEYFNANATLIEVLEEMTEDGLLPAEILAGLVGGSMVA